MTVKNEPVGNAITEAKKKQRANRLNSIRHCIENGVIKDFQGVFAIIRRTNLAPDLYMAPYTLRRKAEDPGQFTVYELLRFAELLNTPYNTMSAFVIQCLSNSRKSPQSNKLRDEKQDQTH
ncbi:MAG: hypothetical protein BGO55_14255 [Sphingobacteriales bacterium 50-39]|nr:hypothetical protein [Sphingobacteriales bacterium]OJW57451.1 MAG: hypothetical protein BGO55_14255 [Sphingobacteriales bacterium 50-39]